MSPEDRMRDYEAGLNLARFDAVEALVSSDAIYWFNDGSYIGLEEVRAAFERTFRSFPLERYWFEDLVWVARGETVAACAYRFRCATTIDGTALAGGGRGANVLRKDAGGWKIVHEHLSQAPAQG